MQKTYLAVGQLAHTGKNLWTGQGKLLVIAFYDFVLWCPS